MLDLNKKLEESLRDLPEQYSISFTDVTLKLSELLKNLQTKINKKNEDQVSDQNQSTKIVELLVQSRGGRIDVEMLEDIIKRMTKVQKITAARIFKKYNIMAKKQDQGIQSNDYENEQLKALEDKIRKKE